MKFVQNFLHPKHARHHPHKWMLALLLSPIHAGEMQYKKRYHLRYNHAKKLFLFDLLLVIFALFVCTATIWWQLYDPTVTANITLTLQGPEDRLTSGERVTISAHYKNNSDVILEDVVLDYQLPTHAIFTTITPEIEHDKSRITLPNIAPGDSGSVSFTFEYISSPNADDDIVMQLLYVQAEKKMQERVTARRTLSVSGSTITIEPIDVPTQISAGNSVPVVLRITNNSASNKRITIASLVAPGITFVPDRENDDEVESGASRDIAGKLFVDAIPSGEVALHFYPVAYTKESSVSQHSTRVPVQIVAPAVRIASAWQQGITTLTSGQIGLLDITLANTGNVPLQNILVTVPFPTSRVSAAKLREHGRVTNGILTITDAYDAALLSLAPGASHQFTLPFSILDDANANALNELQLTPRVIGSLPGSSTITVTDSAQAPSIRLGGSVNVVSRSWYYTAEGDQLGRGPLPPQVAKETKYWVSFTAQNGTSNLSNIRVNGTLAPGVSFTGKTSVSAGSDITYDEATKSWTYRLDTLAKGTSLGVHMELAITPGAGDIGEHLPLVENMIFFAHDNAINTSITRTVPNVTTALLGDTHAAKRGTHILP